MNKWKVDEHSHWSEKVRNHRVAYAVSTFPFIIEFQVKPGRIGSVAGWVTIWVEPRVDSQTWGLM